MKYLLFLIGISVFGCASDAAITKNDNSISAGVFESSSYKIDIQASDLAKTFQNIHEFVSAGYEPKTLDKYQKYFIYIFAGPKKEMPGIVNFLAKQGTITYKKFEGNPEIHDDSIVTYDIYVSQQTEQSASVTKSDYFLDLDVGDTKSFLDSLKNIFAFYSAKVVAENNTGNAVSVTVTADSLSSAKNIFEQTRILGLVIIEKTNFMSLKTKKKDYLIEIKALKKASAISEKANLYLDLDVNNLQAFIDAAKQITVSFGGIVEKVDSYGNDVDIIGSIPMSSSDSFIEQISQHGKIYTNKKNSELADEKNNFLFVIRALQNQNIPGEPVVLKNTSDVSACLHKSPCSAYEYFLATDDQFLEISQKIKNIISANKGLLLALDRVSNDIEKPASLSIEASFSNNKSFQAAVDQVAKMVGVPANESIDNRQMQMTEAQSNEYYMILRFTQQ